MRIFTLTLVIFSLLHLNAMAQDKPSYRIFNKDGRASSYQEMLTALSKTQIVLFGELHDNSINHWLELQVLKDLYAKQPAITIGMEMFESDDQVVLNEFLSEVIEERHLLSETKAWDNYKHDYKPLVDFARKNKLPVIATNIPRRYANLVYRKGIESLNSLPVEVRNLLAPLPITIDLELPGYKDMIAAGAHGGSGSAENMARSQAVKDATMAYFITKHRTNNNLFIHYHGTYHSKNYEGIFWYLKKSNPSLQIITIHSVEQDSLESLANEHTQSADFILVVPKDMTKTY